MTVARQTIGEMAIVWGVFAAISGVVTVAAAFILNESTALRQDVILYGCASLWLVLVCWVWLEFVRIGRWNVAGRVSARDLIRLQLVATGVLLMDVVFARLLLRNPDLFAAMQAMELVFEWIVLVFHAIYFSLAWGMRAPVPARTYLLALLLLGIVSVQTPFPTVASGASRMAWEFSVWWARRGSPS